MTSLANETLLGVTGVTSVVQCAFCLEMPERAMVLGITRCGHTFCEVCIVHWLNTNHSCPTCKQKCITTDLTRNRMIEAVVEEIKIASEKADVALIEKVFVQSKIQKDDNEKQSFPLQSIEQTFAKHLKSVYKEFSQYEKLLHLNYQKACQPLLKSFKNNQDKNMEKIELLSLKERYENAMFILNEDLNIFLNKTCEPLSLLPSTVTVIVKRYINMNQQENNNVILANNIDKSEKEVISKSEQHSKFYLPDFQFNMRLYNTTIPLEVIEMAQEQCLKHKSLMTTQLKMIENSISIILKTQMTSNEFDNINNENMNELNIVNFQSNELSAAEAWSVGASDVGYETIQIDHTSSSSSIQLQQPLFRYKANNRVDTYAYSDILLIEGEIEINSLKCFALRFNKHEAIEGNDEDDATLRRRSNNTTEYYRCEDCKLNWICHDCSQHCHEGHVLTLYMANHTPTWACCYCSKKKSKTLCKLCN